jgi:hypothetical protein
MKRLGERRLMNWDVLNVIDTIKSAAERHKENGREDIAEGHLVVAGWLEHMIGMAVEGAEEKT